MFSKHESNKIFHMFDYPDSPNKSFTEQPKEQVSNNPNNGRMCDDMFKLEMVQANFYECKICSNEYKVNFILCQDCKECHLHAKSERKIGRAGGVKTTIQGQKASINSNSQLKRGSFLRPETSSPSHKFKKRTAENVAFNDIPLIIAEELDCSKLIQESSNKHLKNPLNFNDISYEKEKKSPLLKNHLKKEVKDFTSRHNEKKN